MTELYTGRQWVVFKDFSVDILILYGFDFSRRRTYGSSKESLSCYGGRNKLASVASSNNGAKKIPRNKTPYSSVPPPPVKKKNLTKVIN